MTTKAPVPIAIVNKSTVANAIDLPRLVAAAQKALDNDFCPCWGRSYALTIQKDIPANHWAIVFLDDADQAGALGYHDLTADDQPLGKIFVKTTLDAGEQVSVTFTHELFEMCADPKINLVVMEQSGNRGRAREVADAVEEDSYLVDGIEISNFVTPAWFEEFRTHAAGVKFDHMGLLTAPLQLRPGGYIGILKHGTWTEQFGSQAKQERFQSEHHGRHAMRCSTRLPRKSLPHTRQQAAA